MGAIVVTGLAANDPVPGSYIEVNFAQGEAAGSSRARSICLLGNKTSSGSATVDSVIYGPDTNVQLQTEADAIALFGAGSELHRMFRRVVAVNRDTAVYAVAVTESAGTNATGTITFTNNATGNGSARIWVHDEFVDVAFSSGDTPTNMADAAVLAINQRTHWGVTAANVAGVITITAKQKGPRGNFIRYQTTITSGVSTTLTPTADTAMTGGATADSNATALTTILPKFFYYIVSAAEDATQLGALVTQIGTQAAPTVGIRQVCFGGSVDTLANATTVATGRNSARCEIVWQERSDWTPSELAANQAAIEAQFETAPNPRTNFAGFGNDPITQAYWQVPAQRGVTYHPSRISIKSALNNGLTPIGVNPSGTTYLVDRATTRSLSGAVNDYRIREPHKVRICDFFGDDVQAKLLLQFAGKRIANDVPQGARPPGPDVATPSVVRGAVLRVIDDYDSNDLWDDAQKVRDGLLVQRETSPTTRMGIRVPARPCANLTQFAVQVNQVT